jgi:hypothetical protein
VAAAGILVEDETAGQVSDLAVIVEKAGLESIGWNQ